MNIALWVVQGLLALAFGFAGVSKAFPPFETVKKNFPWAVTLPRLVRFIGGAELLGAIGLILPGLLHILTWLTIAAAAGLAIIMISAAIFHFSRREFSPIGINVVLLLLTLLIIIGRLVLAPF